MRIITGCFWTALALGIVAGCNPAGKYGRPRGVRANVPTEPASETKPASETMPDPRKPGVPATPPLAPTDVVWEEPDVRELEPPVPIKFYTEAADRNEWLQLRDFWNVVSDVNQRPTPEQAAVLVGAAPWNLAPLAAQVNQVIKIKVPLGLEDPLASTPPANRPTRGKWELGKQLFFDEHIFLQPATAETKTSCARCHGPSKGFSDGKAWSSLGNFVTPRLLNVGYGSAQFWDGRAGSLEEVVQRSMEERTGEPGRHSWTGIVQRLRDDPHYDFRFRKVFGTPATQDAIGKAIATYLRTVLSGNSLQDRVERDMRVRGAKVLEVADYQKALDSAALKALQPEEGMTKEAVARQLHEGFVLFHGKAACAACHGGSTYTDHGFHNLGVGDSAQPVRLVGKEIGRFAVLPPGLKDRRMIGAYKTPSLRSLPRNGPFFHDGLLSGADTLFEAIRVHVKPNAQNPWLDPAIRPIEVSESEVRSLMLFLKALDGEPPPEFITKAPEPLERIPAPKK